MITTKIMNTMIANNCYTAFIAIRTKAFGIEYTFVAYNIEHDYLEFDSDLEGLIDINSELLYCITEDQLHKLIMANIEDGKITRYTK